MLLTVFSPELAYAADGSGTATANPTSVRASSTGNTVTVIYTATETMNSGEVRLTIPTGWSAPQGSSGTAGYTQATTTGMLAKVEDNADVITGWASGTACTTTAVAVDATTKHEGTSSISCGNGTEALGDFWYKNITAENWSSYTKVGFWIYASAAVTATHLQFSYSSATNLGTILESISVGALSATTWTYVSLTLNVARTSVQSFGFRINDATGMNNKTVKVDDILLGYTGPNVTPTFASQNASVRILTLSSTQTVTLTYGSGGGTSGATAPATLGAHTFTVANRVTDSSASLVNIGTSPIVYVAPAATKALVGLQGQTVNSTAITLGTCPSVNGGAAVTIAGTPTTQTANTAFTVCVYATDASGNFDSLATQSTTITSNPNDAQGVYPGAAALVAGKGTFSLTLKTAQSYTVTGTPSGLTAGTSSSITIQPSTASTFTVTTQHSGTEVAGTTFSVTLTAKDAYANIVSSGANNYTGSKTINWTWTATNSPNSTAPTKPANGAQTFSNGVVTVSGFTLTNAGQTPTITGTDPSAPNPTGTSASITVQPATAATFTVVTQNGGTEVAGTAFSVTLTAKDAYGNTVSAGANNYTGPKTINWTWTATASPNDSVAPTKPSNGSQSFTNGVLTLAGFTLTNAGETPTITGTDPNAPNPAGTSAAITINPGATNKLVITTWPDSVSVDTEATQYVVQRRDAVGNPTTSGTQQVDLTSNSTGTYQFRDTSGGGTVTFVTIGAGVSTENFFYIDDTVGNWTISVAFGGLTGDSKSLSVLAISAPSGFGGTALSTTSIRWSWTDNSAAEDGFRLYDGSGVLIVEIATPNTGSYGETGLSPNTPYTRYVRTYKGTSESASSNSATVKTSAPAPAPSLAPPAPAEVAQEEEEVPVEEEKEAPAPQPTFWEQVRETLQSWRNAVLEMVSDSAAWISTQVRALGRSVRNLGDNLVYMSNRIINGFSGTVGRIVLGLDKFREIVFVREPIRIFEVMVAEVSGTEVVISWKTNHLSTSQINYGSALGTYEFASYSEQQTREHRIVLADLNPQTTYYYELISKNRDYAVDAFRSFTTLGE